MPKASAEEFKQAEDQSIVGEDSRSLELTHYVLAERLMQVEYWNIQDSILKGSVDDSLVYMLEGGFRGFHSMTGGELWSEWQEQEERFYELYESGSLPWELFEDDPLCALEQDENGEVATYGDSQSVGC